jgi:hypothetical protein
MTENSMDSIDNSIRNLNAYLIVILLVSLALRVWGISYGMPYSFILDETYLVNRSLSLGTGDLNPHLFEWPGHLLMYALLAIYGLYFVLGYAAGIFSSAENFALSFLVDPSHFYIIGRAFMVLLSMVTVYVTYRVGARAYDRMTGLIAAFFLAVSPLVSGISHFALTDTPVMLLSILVFLPVLRIIHEGRTRDYILAGLIVGAGVAVKYNAGALVIPVLSGHLLHILRNKKPLKGIVFHRGLWLSGAALLFGFVAGCPYCLLDYPTFVRDVVFQFSRVSSVGMINAEYASPFLYYLRESLAGGIGTGITAVCILGAVRALYRRGDADIVLMIFIASYFMYVSSWKVAIDKYLMPLIPAILVIGASLLRELFGILPVSGRRKGYIIVLCVLALAAGPLMKSLRVDHTLTQKDSRTIAKEWIEENIKDGTRIAIDSGRLDIAKLSPPLNDTPDNLYRIFVEKGMIDENKYLRSGGNIFDKYYQLLTRASSGRKYPLTRIVLRPDGRIDRNISVEGLKKLHVEYVVVSSFAYEGYESPAFRQNHPEVAEYYSRFYGDLEKQCILIKEFRSDPDRRQGPTIRIYKMPGRAFEGSYAGRSQ